MVIFRLSELHQNINRRNPRLAPLDVIHAYWLRGGSGYGYALQGSTPQVSKLGDNTEYFAHTNHAYVGLYSIYGPGASAARGSRYLPYRQDVQAKEDQEQKGDTEAAIRGTIGTYPCPRNQIATKCQLFAKEIKDNVSPSVAPIVTPRFVPQQHQRKILRCTWQLPL
jgi:hypothetical protein